MACIHLHVKILLVYMSRFRANAMYQWSNNKALAMSADTAAVKQPPMRPKKFGLNNTNPNNLLMQQNRPHV